MREVGVVLHQAKSGRLIVKVSDFLDSGSILLDSKGRKVGKVIETIGPVGSPYASLELHTTRVKGILGGKVYLKEGRK